MRFIGYNIIPILLIGLAWLLILMNKDGYGWCIASVVLTTVIPSCNCNDEPENEENE